MVGSVLRCSRKLGGSKFVFLTCGEMIVVLGLISSIAGVVVCLPSN